MAKRRFLLALLICLGVLVLAGAVGCFIQQQDLFFWPDSIPDEVWFIALAVVPISILAPLDLPLFFIGQIVGIEAALAFVLWICHRHQSLWPFVAVMLVVAYVAAVLGTNFVVMLMG